ncbi:hypothetical protein HDV62DRAFT_146891 [Trichoderma sp. SZMC 28011]
MRVQSGQRYHLLYGVPGPIIVHCGIGRKAHKVSRRRLQRHRTASGLSEFHHTPSASACVRVLVLYLGANRGGPVLCITSCMTCPYRTPRLHTDMPHQPNDTAVLSNFPAPGLPRMADPGPVTRSSLTDQSRSTWGPVLRAAALDAVRCTLPNLRQLTVRVYTCRTPDNAETILELDCGIGPRVCPQVRSMSTAPKMELEGMCRSV